VLVAKVLALVRANWLTAVSYRMQTVFSFAGMFAAIVPLYFISRALQSTMKGVIQGEAPEYFGFLIVGLITFSFVRTAVVSLHTSLSGEISTGSLEALLSTPTSIPTLLAGMVGYAFALNVMRASLIFSIAWLLGAHVVWSHAGAAVLIVALIVASYIPLGIIAASLVLAFRTTGPFPTLVLGISVLLGGVYYPTHAVPAWLERISMFVPLTYGLRALRRTVLDGSPLTASAMDLAVLAGFAVALMTTALLAFSWALQYSRRAGTLAQY
jgi:ABC-2 type transport system permease protein